MMERLGVRPVALRADDRIAVHLPGRSEQVRRPSADHWASDEYWAALLDDALREDRLTLFFQPIVSIDGREAGHHEALVRLLDRAGYIIAADRFIPSAERCGLIGDIDRLVTTAAIDWTMAERARGNLVRCAINLSGLSFEEESMLRYLERAILSSAIDPDLVTFEITETSALVNLAQARRAMLALRELGCHFALDDFGKGFSSFAYLRMLPVDFLKIDGVFVRHVATNSVDRALVRSINELAHALGIQTVAECVEDEGALRVLGEIGVDFAQGYYVAPPSDVTLGPVLRASAGAA